MIIINHYPHQFYKRSWHFATPACTSILIVYVREEEEEEWGRQGQKGEFSGKKYNHSKWNMSEGLIWGGGGEEERKQQCGVPSPTKRIKMLAAIATRKHKEHPEVPSILNIQCDHLSPTKSPNRTSNYRSPFQT